MTPAPARARPAGRRLTSAAVLASFFLATMLGLGGLSSWHQWRAERSKAGGMARALSIAAAEQIGGSLRTIDLLIQHVGQYVMENREMNAPMVAAAMDIQSRSFPEMAALVVSDQNGLAHDERDGPPIDISHRDYFLLQRQMYRDNRVVVDGPLRDAESGEWQVVLSRPLVDAQGQFRGVVAAVLKSSFFADPLSATGMTDPAVVTLFNVNGVVFGRFPDGESWIGRTLPLRPPPGDGLSEEGRAEEGKGIFQTRGLLEGIDQIAAWRQIPQYPLTVVTAIPVETVRAAWRQGAAHSVLLAAILGAAMIYLAFRFDHEERQRLRATEALAQLNRDLERRVDERTRSLQAEVAERSRAEAHSARLKAAYQDLFDGAIEGLLIHRDFKPLLANSSCAQLFGFDRVEDLLALPSLLPFIHPDWQPTIERANADTLSGRGPETLEFAGRRRDGEPFWALNSLRRVQWDGGAAIQSAFVNITASKDWQEQLADAKEAAEKASTLKSRFLAVASHDLRQPVQALSFYVNVLARRMRVEEEDGRPSVESESQSILRRIGESTDSLRGLVDSLLDMSKLEGGLVRPEQRGVPLLPLLERLWALYCPVAEQAGVSLTVVPSSCQVLSDPVLLERILQNLVTNAIRYTPAGGKVLVGCRRHGGRLAIQVADTGEGIASDMLPRVFEEFFRVSGSSEGGSGGLGLGLAIVHRLCELLQHRLSVRSRLGQGSVFEVTVEREGGLSVPAETASPAAALCRPALGCRVLVVDDDPYLRESLAWQLEDWGAVVRTAASAAQALDLAAAEGCDLVLAEERLTRGDGGTRLMARLRERLGRPDLRAILLTDDPTTPADGNDRLLHKPVAPETLSAVLAEVLAKGPLAAV